MPMDRFLNHRQFKKLFIVTVTLFHCILWSFSDRNLRSTVLKIKQQRSWTFVCPLRVAKRPVLTRKEEADVRSKRMADDWRNRVTAGQLMPKEFRGLRVTSYDIMAARTAALFRLMPATRRAATTHSNDINGLAQIRLCVFIPRG